MNRVLSRKQPPNGRSLLLENIDWRTYSRLLHAFANQPRIRLTYDQGRLEIMPPMLAHEDDAGFLGRMVEALTEELRLAIRSGGSTTLRRQLRQRGIEAAKCFWIKNAPRMKGRRRLNLRRDPPADLAIEVDVSHSSLDRLGIYAALNVPEIWRLEHDELHFYLLGDDGQYASAGHSLSLPMVTPAVLVQFLKRARRAADQNLVLRTFRAWVRRNRNKHEKSR